MNLGEFGVRSAMPLPSVQQEKGVSTVFRAEK